MNVKRILVTMYCMISAYSSYALEQVYDASADINSGNIIKALMVLQMEQGGLKDKTESIQKSSEETMKYSEKVKEYTGKISEYSEKISDYTNKVQDWLGDAKEWTLDNIEELTGIEDLEANCTEIANESIEIGKTLYGVYNVGSNIYETGYNAYESFANMDGSIDGMIDNMKNLSQARTDIMAQIKTLSYKQSAAKSLNEIQKNQAGYSAAQLKMQSLQAQTAEQTNMILLQNQAIRNAEKRHEQMVYDKYQNARVEMWKDYYKDTSGELMEDGDFNFYE